MIQHGGDASNDGRLQGQIEFNQLANSTPSVSVKEALAPYQIDEAAKHIGAMLAGTKRSDEALILSAGRLLQNIAAPQRGNRKEARASNAAGLNALRKGDPELAAKNFLNAAKADPADKEVLNNLAHALYKSQRFDDSLPVLLATLSLAPRRTSAWVDLAMVLSIAGKSDTAVAAYSLAYRFSQDQLKTKDFLRQLIEKDPSEKVKKDAQRALEQIN